MNILFVDQFSELGGAQLCLLDLMPAIVELGWHPHVAVPGSGPLVDGLAAMDVRAHSLPSQSYSNGHKTAIDVARFTSTLASTTRTLATLVRQHSIHLVYVNGPRLLPAVALTGCPMIFHAHSFLEKRYTRVLSSLSLRSRHAEVIAVSNFAASALAPLLPENRVRIVYSGVPDHGPRSNRSGPLRIGIIGRIAPEKGHLAFIQAAKILGNTHPEVQFVVCGSALFSDSTYAEQVQKQSGGLNIEYLGWQQDIGPVLRNLDILAVPSQSNDAAPRVVLEALSAGVPLVAFPSGGIPELLTPGTGVLTTESTPEALARGLQSLIESSETRQKLSAAGRLAWAKRFQVERYRQEIASILESYAPKRSLEPTGPPHFCP